MWAFLIGGFSSVFQSLQMLCRVFCNLADSSSVKTNQDLQRVQNRCLNVIGLPRDTVESLVTRRQNLTRKEFKRILESEAHPCKHFLDKPVDHGHNLRCCKTNPVHLRILVSRTVRHKQLFIPRGAKLNLIWYVYIICSVLNFYCNITVILIAKGNK